MMKGFGVFVWCIGISDGVTSRHARGDCSGGVL